MNNIKPKTTWQHRNGNVYEVIMLTNEQSTNDNYPVNVVYRGNNGNVWSRPISDWNRSFVEFSGDNNG